MPVNEKEKNQAWRRKNKAHQGTHRQRIRHPGRAQKRI